MGNGIWKEFSEKERELFSFTNGKRVILWGYGTSGWFVEHLFRRKNRGVEYIIDDGDLSQKLKVYRSFFLKRCDPDTHAVILSFKHDGKAERFLEELGYICGINYIYARDVFYERNFDGPLSYYSWLDYWYKTDIVKFVSTQDLKYSNANFLAYSGGLEYSLVDVLDNFVFDSSDAVFDFGCGKGGALILFAKNGATKIGGVEYDSGLYDTLKNNFSLLGLDDGRLICGDASNVEYPLDEYNYFYMYNPFIGGTFRSVIRHIKDSFTRVPRRITLIYAGACRHEDVIGSDNMFKLSKEIYTDCWSRYVNIYTIPVH